jgi:heptosyltransferase II
MGLEEEGILKRLLFGVLGLLIRALDLILRKKLPFPPRNIYFLRTHAAGDVLLATAAVRAARLAWPQAHISMLVGQRSRQALEGNPYIDSLESFPEEWWFGKKYGKILGLTYRIFRKRKDVLVILHASPLIHLWGFLLNAPIRVGFDENGSGFALTHPVARENEDYDRYLGDVNLDLVRALGISTQDSQLDFFPSEAELNAVRRFIPVPGSANRRLLLGIAPGGGQNAFEKTNAKHWPAGHFAKLIASLAGKHAIDFLLLGDRNDARIGEAIEIANGCDERIRLVNLMGKTTFRELAALIHYVDILVTNDSAPLHLAVAQDKPVVALFGPTANWALFPPGPGRQALQSPSPCSPCYTYGRFPGCPAPNCMADLSVQTVEKSAESLIEELRAKWTRKKMGGEKW